MTESKADVGYHPHQKIADHPVHFPASIQPHGILLVLDADFSILQVSANIEKYLGIEPQQLLRTSLDDLVDATQHNTISQSLSHAQNRVIPFKLSLKTPNGLTHFDSFLHQTEDAVILEMESASVAKQDNFPSIHALVRDTIERMQQATTRAELLTILVNEIRKLTGYDRVIVYRFDEQDAGEVIAEAIQADLSPYLGLHFPAHDIPALTRELYAQGKLRMIPDMQAAPIELVPPLHPKTSQPLDLSVSTLRSVDPCCAEYYRNMGMSASLVASLIKEQTLWGLLSCHHATPKHLPYEVRAACELLVQMTTSELANKVRQENLDQQSKLYALQSELIASIAQADNFIDALVIPEERLLTLVNASGAAICLGEHLTLVGTTPSIEHVRSLIAWADGNISDNLFHTHSLSKRYPEAETFKPTASGLLLLRISKVQHYLILWFRPEVSQAVNWGGNPDDGIHVDEHGGIQLCPRSSFERWQEMVHASSLPWRSFEINGALELRNAIIGIVLKKADDLAKLNRELEHSNRELAAFAYAAAHDLKEPLRGIYNYADILLEDYAQVLDDEGLDYLTEIQSFSQRMELLINALLRIAQLRQTQLQLQRVDLNNVLQQVIDVTRASRPEISFDVRIPRSLPQIQCDRVLIHEVFRNLISNAIKYNDQSPKWIEVGYQEMAHASEDGVAAEDALSHVFYIRDNGIGIRDDHLSHVFTLFKRLHPQDHYGGGAGVGLAIVNQIIERHGGRIWVESKVNDGSTFYFTLEGN